MALKLHILSNSGWLGNGDRPRKPQEENRMQNTNKGLKTFRRQMAEADMLPPGPLNATTFEDEQSATEELVRREFADDQPDDSNLLLPASILAR